MRNTTFLAVLALLAGCSGSGTSTSTGELTLEEENGRASGLFVDHSAELGEVVFSSEFVDTNVLEIVMTFHGMTITSLVDFDSGVIEHDGFADANGEDTQLVDDDRALIAAFSHALDSLGANASEPVRRLRAFTSTWSEYPTTVDLQGIALADADRDWSSLCYAYGTYVGGSHDCSYTRSCPWYNPWFCRSGNWWADDTTVNNVMLSMAGDGPCSDGTWFSSNGQSWSCYEPNHDVNQEFGSNGCFGRCGGGCGSDTQFTQDCVNHDQCVRFGHDLASLYCDDQFTSTTDDWAFAPDC